MVPRPILFGTGIVKGVVGRKGEMAGGEEGAESGGRCCCGGKGRQMETDFSPCRTGDDEQPCRFSRRFV